ncbi:MAG TPA: sensor histidine kinase [Phenylobacterium sp.]|uniref:sensor histidine kinase n=1 Tax=Phenylobacterium sp. TaxID=1871053 RepID=UPI002B467C48|nr:sensor histidine kinase [Phenylobacterium sp.]HKR87561.1 sensor histidine kinase [Phenylobacterium sp.]
MAEARHAQPLSIRARLVLLVVALLLPALLLTGGLLWSLEVQAHRTQERQLAAAAQALSLVVDGRIAAQVATVSALATSPNLRQANWRAFDAEARAALDDSESWISIRGADGRQYVNTSRPPDAPVTVIQTPVSSWSGARAGAKISNLVWGTVSKQYITIVMKPLRLDNGEPVRLSVVTRAGNFAKVLARQGLPPRWSAGVLDGRGQVVADSRGGTRMVGRLAPADLRAALTAQPGGVARNLRLEGKPTIVASARTPDAGWTAIVAAPRDETLGAVREAMLLGLFIGLLLLAAAILLALRIGRQITRPVETVATAASDWVAGRAATFPTHTGLTETDGLSRAFASALAAVRERDERQKLLMNELNHRVKNTLATVQAVALHTRTGAGTVEEFHDALEGRVIAMSRAHELLTRADWEGAELGELARQTLSAFASPQLKISGPELQVGPTDALNLALVFYELATNAAKHGALSSDAGQVTLTWWRVQAGARICWSESGGPPVSAPTRKGFGSRLIGRAMHDLQPSRLSYDVGGVRCELTLRAPDAVPADPKPLRRDDAEVPDRPYRPSGMTETGA